MQYISLVQSLVTQFSDSFTHLPYLQAQPPVSLSFLTRKYQVCLPLCTGKIQTILLDGHRDISPTSPFKDRALPRCWEAVSRYPPTSGSFRVHLTYQEPSSTHFQRKPKPNDCWGCGWWWHKTLRDRSRALSGAGKGYQAFIIVWMFISRIMVPPSPFHRCWSLVNIQHSKRHLTFASRAIRDTSESIQTPITVSVYQPASVPVSCDCHL